MIKEKNISKAYIIFLLSHILIWTIVPSVSNTNLPLDTIEALAWGSNLEWGFNKHPPLSAFVIELFYFIFGKNDWAYYFLSQVCVAISFVYVWKLSNVFFKSAIYSFLSLIILECIFLYNYTTPEFNVNIIQLPFWSITAFYFWKSIETNSKMNWILLGVFSALGFLSKYLFAYLLISIFIFLFFDFKKNKKYFPNFLISLSIMLLLLSPHLFWLLQNDFITVLYGLKRSSLYNEYDVLSHIINPVIFITKQIVILTPILIILSFIIKKFEFKINLKLRKNIFLISITVLPIFLILITSVVLGAKIRTMWMTPFYLFLGILFFQIFQKNIDLTKLKRFYFIFLFFFISYPIAYMSVSILDDTKRTDYPGREIARLVQNKWDDNFTNEIKIVIGDEWSAGNLSYHLSSRPKWVIELKDKSKNLKKNEGVIYTGNPKILKKICPGVFGTIKPVGYCMIGKR